MKNFFVELSLSFGKVPETLYHYTSQSGLIGIIRDNEIWMTHTQYLNDSQEFHDAIGFVEEEIKRQIAVATGVVEKTVLGEMLGAIDQDHTGMNVCVCSFSEDGDSLSQWRAYGGSASGYSIGFCGSFLEQVAKQEDHFLLAKCIYDAKDKRTLATQFVDANLREILTNRNIPSSDPDYEYWHSGGGLLAHLNKFAPIFKDGSFFDEKEWRVISKPLNCTAERFDYRLGRSMITPFYHLPITNDAEHQGEKRFRKIFVGPTPHRELSKRSVSNLLASQRLASNFTPGGPVTVENSNIPYRSW